MDREAKGVYRRFTGNTDDFPRRGTRWFHDWFYPLWREFRAGRGHERLFRELARHFPRGSRRDLHAPDNWGNCVHFTSGAAAADMSGQAAAFGSAPRVADQLEHAHKQFPRHRVLKYWATTGPWPIRGRLRFGGRRTSARSGAGGT